MLRLSGMYVYPIKSLAGIAVASAKVEPRGLQYDRRWMLVNEAGRFMSQREFPAMALLGTAIETDILVVFDRQNPTDKIGIPLQIEEQSLPLIPVTVWDDAFSAPEMPAVYGDWFSKKLGMPLRLVAMPDTVSRPTDPRYAEGHVVSFADGYPFLVIGQASLDHLNSLLEQPLPMNRFRPNLVFTGGEPYEEDAFGTVQIGDTLFEGVKRCGRCIMTTTDQDTGERAAEPIKTLATYRKVGKSIIFGENLIWLGPADSLTVLHVGDTLQKVVE